MFEKIAIAITTFIIVMFIALYYYQSGTDAPKECMDLYNDYVKLTKMIESDEYNASAHKIFSEEKINHIYNIEKNYHRLLKERFRRSGFDDFKTICINAKSTMNLPEIIQALEDQRTKDLEETTDQSNRKYNFLI